MLSFYKNSSKIFLTFLAIFLFSFFIQTKNVSAFRTIGNDCGVTSVTETQYILTTAERDGKINLCFNDTAGNMVDIYLGRDRDGTLIHSTTTTGVNQYFLYSTSSVSLGTNPFKFITYDQGALASAQNTFTLTLKPAFRVKFFNPNPTDNDLTDTFATVTVNSAEKTVKTNENIFPIIISEATSTKTALGGDIANLNNYTTGLPAGQAYEFKGWYPNTIVSSTTPYNFNNTDMSSYIWNGSNTVKVYAKWELTCNKTNGYRLVNESCSNKYTVTFNGNGGTPALTTKSVVYNTATSTPAVTKTTTGGSYEFLRWGTTKTSATGFTSVTPNIIGDITFYAIWGTLTCNPTYELSASGNSCVPIQTPTPPCGITSTSTPTTNGTACPITMTAATSTNGTQFQGNVVSS